MKSANSKIDVLQAENDQLKAKRSPNIQMKKEIEDLKEQISEKDNAIDNLKKSIKEEKSLRMNLMKQKQKIEANTEVKKQEDKDTTNMRAEIASLKKTIKDLEVSKWEIEKKLKEQVEHCKNKLKEKSNEITILEKNYEKSKMLVMKYENELKLIQTKLTKHQPSNVPKTVTVNKQVQISNDDDLLKKLKNDLKKVSEENKNLQIKVKNLEERLEKQIMKEKELKTLLQESLQREKLTTIFEENEDKDNQMEQLLQENAQLKVELRMTEFEMKKQFKS